MSSKSTSKRNIHASKIMLCIWWDQKSYILWTSPSETIIGDRYRLQLIRLNQALKKKRPKRDNRHNKLILLHNNDRTHVAKPIKKYLKGVKWEILLHSSYTPYIAPSDFYLFRSMQSVLSGEQFLWRYQKMAWWMDRFDRIFFSSRNLFITTGKVREC